MRPLAPLSLAAVRWMTVFVSAFALCTVLTGCGFRAVTPWCSQIDGELDPDCTPDGAVDVARQDAIDVRDVVDVFDAPDVLDDVEVPDEGPEVVECEGELTLCAGRCVSIADDPNHCGGCGQRCPGAPGARTTCTMGVCGVVCLEGFDRVGDVCEPPAPRPIAPLSTATVTSQQPTMRWEMLPGVDGARIDLCRDRALTMQCQTLEANGTRGRPAAALARGVWFWRVRARYGGRVGMRSSPVWQFTVGARSAPVDTSHGTSLDINGDGFADFAVGNPAFQGGTGRVHVYLGSARGPSATPARSVTGSDGVEGRFGTSVASAGDINGDGFADLAVAAPNAMGATGRVYLYLGSATGLSTTPAQSLAGPDGPNGRFGNTVASAGDVNGDGYADLVVLAPEASGGRSRVHVYLGSASGLSAMPAFAYAPSDFVGPGWILSAASGGDLNGDGFADLAVGIPRPTGRSVLHVFLGSAAGLPSAPTLSLSGPDSDDVVFGRWVACVGDVNGDGYADVAASTQGRGMTGWVHVYFGSATGLSRTPSATLRAPTRESWSFGGTLVAAGDLNGDGYGDLVATDLVSPWSPDAPDRGKWVYVYLGRATGFSTTPFLSLRLPVDTGNIFDQGVPSGRDLNGDGYADLVLGTPSATRPTGEVRVYSGRAAGPSMNPDFILTGPDDGDGYFGGAIARLGPFRALPGGAQGTPGGYFLHPSGEHGGPLRGARWSIEGARCSPSGTTAVCPG